MFSVGDNDDTLNTLNGLAMKAADGWRLWMPCAGWRSQRVAHERAKAEHQEESRLLRERRAPICECENRFAVSSVIDVYLWLLLSGVLSLLHHLHFCSCHLLFRPLFPLPSSHMEIILWQMSGATFTRSQLHMPSQAWMHLKRDLKAVNVLTVKPPLQGR